MTLFPPADRPITTSVAYHGKMCSPEIIYRAVKKGGVRNRDTNEMHGKKVLKR